MTDCKIVVTMIDGVKTTLTNFGEPTVLFSTHPIFQPTQLLGYLRSERIHAENIKLAQVKKGRKVVLTFTGEQMRADPLAAMMMT